MRGSSHDLYFCIILLYARKRIHAIRTRRWRRRRGFSPYWVFTALCSACIEGGRRVGLLGIRWKHTWKLLTR